MDWALLPLKFYWALLSFLSRTTRPKYPIHVLPCFKSVPHFTVLPSSPILFLAVTSLSLSLSCKHTMVSISVLTEENVNPLNNGSNTTNSFSTTLSISSSSVSSNSSSSNRCSGVVDTTKTSDSLKRKRPLKIQLPSSILREIQFEKIKTKDNMIVEDQQPLEYMDLGVGVFCKKGKKRFMEDTHKIVSGLNGNPKKGFYGVYDGHGGRKAAEFVAEHLHQNILNILEKSEGNMTKEEAVKAAYLKTDDEFLKQGLGSGTCCVTCLVEEKNIVVSNVGDCRAVLCRGGVAESLTIDHRVEQEGERRRIEKKGGYVEIHRGAWRVHGILSVSRSIGDAHLKDWVEAEPDTKTLDLTPEMNFIVLASDGLWDKVENQEVVDTALRVCLGPDKVQLTNDCWKEDDEFACENTSPPSKSRRISLVKQQKVKSHSPLQQIKHNRKRPVSNRLVAACKELVNLAVTRGSLDDITVMIIDLHHLGCNS